MVPAQNDFFEAIPVSDAVNKVTNDTATNQKRVLPRKPQADKLPVDDDQLSMF